MGAPRTAHLDLFARAQRVLACIDVSALILCREKLVLVLERHVQVLMLVTLVPRVRETREPMSLYTPLHWLKTGKRAPRNDAKSQPAVRAQPDRERRARVEVGLRAPPSPLLSAVARALTSRRPCPFFSIFFCQEIWSTKFQILYCRLHET